LELERKENKQLLGRIEQLELKNNEVNSKIQQLESKSLLNIEKQLKLQPNPYNSNMYSVKADGLSVKFINIIFVFIFSFY
jgi:predicted nuclease with TOPRIM domain